MMALDEPLGKPIGNTGNPTALRAALCGSFADRGPEGVLPQLLEKRARPSVGDHRHVPASLEGRQQRLESYHRQKAQAAKE